MNALTKQFLKEATKTNRLTVAVNRGALEGIDQLLDLLNEPGVGLQEVMDVIDVFEDEIIAKAKELRKLIAAETDVDFETAEGSDDIASALRRLASGSEGIKGAPDPAQPKGRALAHVQGRLRAVKVVLAAIRGLEGNTGTEECANRYRNWREPVKGTAAAWRQAWSEELARCQERLKDLEAAAPA